VRGSNAGVWLEASVRYALAEARSPRPGGAGVLAKLAEVLFIEVLRLYMNEQSTGRTGWLAGVGDRIVGAALNALHARPAHAWTLEELARAANTSRSVLAERFAHLVGSSPMQYLTQWRMLLAANLLSRSSAAGAHRRRRRLPDRHRVQPRLPARVRHAAGRLAAPPRRQRGALNAAAHACLEFAEPAPGRLLSSQANG
jgi:AraC-like DNA-binding protein